MKTLSIKVNGKHCCTIGFEESIDDYEKVGGVLHAVGVNHGLLDLHAGGLDGKTKEHLRWAVPELSVGDSVTIGIGESEPLDPPAERYFANPGRAFRLQSAAMLGMTFDDPFTPRVLLSLQRAMLGEVFAGLRALGVSWDSKQVRIRAVVDGDVQPDDIESIGLIETEVIADLPDSISVVTETIRCDSPSPLPDKDDWRWVYWRREPS
jgi:hypothetical protein